MGIELPPELADVAAQAGVAWPEADEEAMARQAQAWRDTATSMATLATDADTTARSALEAASGDAATAASAEWKTFVEPDSGHLTALVRDTNAAADRLEHAANQVGTAKVEIVRNLVGLAQNTDAAHAAAAAGHPLALAGLDTAVRGTAANVANIESQLVSAVQPTSSVDMATVQNPVNANPGHHLLPGVTTTATNAVTHTVTDTAHHTTDTVNHVTGTTTDLARPATGTTGDTGDLVRHGTGVVGDTVDQVAGGAGDLARSGAGAVADTGDLVRHGTGAVGDTVDQAAGGAGDLGRHAAGAVGDTGDLVRHGSGVVGGTVDQVAGGAGDLAQHGADTVDQVAGGAGDLAQHGAGAVGGTADHVLGGGGGAVGGTVDHVLPGGGGPGDVLPGQPGDVLPDRPGSVGGHLGDVLPGQPGDVLPGRPDVGDVLPDRPDGPGDPEVTGPVPAHNFPGDVSTPPAGQTVQAGFAGGLEPSAAAAPNLPPAAAAVAAPANPAAPALGGAPGGIPFAGAPAAPVVGGAPGVPAAGAGGVPAAQPSAAPAARPAAFAPAAPIPAADRPQDPAPRKQMAGPPGAPPPARGERNDVLAAFWIHMFPIGHLPVASYRAARQLPPPPEELDYAAGLRFEPADHPQFHLVDPTPRLAEIRAAFAAREAAKAPSYQDYAPPPGPGYPPPAPAHPAEAVAAGYPPASPDAASPAYPPAAPAEAVVAGYSPAASPGYPPAPAHPAEAVAAGYPPASPDAASPGYQPPAPANPAEAGYPRAHPAETGNPPTAEPATAGQHDPAEADTISGLRPVTPSAGLTADHPTVQALLDNHDPLGGGNERDWDRRYLVRLGSVTAHGISPEGLEYNWPTSEQYPEGGSASGEPEVLDENTVIDRFGTPDGRVFAEDSTPFPQRSLPPEHKNAGYRRYRVTKPLPVWRAVSAAWFGQPGGGVRYRTTHTAVELVALGYLEEIA